ncbi:MAG: hypothetical protein AAGK78_10785, partial [Planctomycetota bacterium]
MRTATAAAKTARRKLAKTVLKPSPEFQPITTFARARRFLDSLSNFEKLRIVRYDDDNFSLGRMRTLCRKLGNPQTKFKAIHVAGTKGKGSTCAMIAAILRAAGFRVGLYASPHLV